MEAPPSTLRASLVASAEMGIDDTSGHTSEDYAELIVAGIPPESTQPREQWTRCWCGTATWHQAGCCSRHYRKPSIVERFEAVVS